MTSDLSPEGSPFKPVDETTWAHELILAYAQDNLDVIGEIVPQKEDLEFWQDISRVNGLSDDALSVELADQFGDEAALADVTVSLANASSVQQQFEILRPLSTGQKASLLELTTRLLAEHNREQQA
jgi:hypothetical protein